MWFRNELSSLAEVSLYQRTQLNCLEVWRRQLRRDGSPKSPIMQEPAVWIVSHSQFVYVCTELYRIMIVFDVVSIQSARRFRTVPMPCFSRRPLLSPHWFLPAGKQTVHLSGCQRRRHISNKHNACVSFAFRRPFGSIRNKCAAFWIWPNTSSRNHNCGTLHCLLKLWSKRNYMI